MNKIKTYRGYTLKEVWRYADLKASSDWEVYRPDQEKGMLFHCKTLSEVQQAINEMVEETITE